MTNITLENINTLAQVASSIIDGDYIYIYNSRASCFSRIEKSLFFAGISGNSGGISLEDIVDNLNSNDTEKALSARQGSVIKGLIDALSQDFGSIVNDSLDSNSASIALSARQGKLLKDALLALLASLRPSAFWEGAPIFDWIGNFATYNVTYSLTKCTKTGDETVIDGNSLTATITPNNRCVLTSVVWTMLGVSHQVPLSDGSVQIVVPKVKGDVSIVAVAESAAITASISVSPSSLTFGSVNVGNSSTRQISVTGTGLTGDLLLSISGNGASNYRLSQNSITKSQAESGAIIVVTFEPQTTGFASAQLTVSGGGATAKAISMSGTGAQQDTPTTSHNISIGGTYSTRLQTYGFVANGGNSQTVEDGQSFSCVINADTSVHADMYIKSVKAYVNGTEINSSWDSTTGVFSISNVTSDVSVFVETYISGVRLCRGYGLGLFGAKTTYAVSKVNGNICYTDFIVLDDVNSGDVLYYYHGFTGNDPETTDYIDDDMGRDFLMFDSNNKFLYFSYKNSYYPWFVRAGVFNITKGRNIAQNHTRDCFTMAADGVFGDGGGTPLHCRMVFKMDNGELAEGTRLYSVKSGGKTYIDAQYSEFYEEFTETAYSITFNLTNCETASKLEATENGVGKDVNILPHERLYLTLFQSPNKTMGTVVVTMNNIDITSSCVTTSGNNRIIQIDDVTGNIVITES